jgi:hypothetical protein
MKQWTKLSSPDLAGPDVDASENLAKAAPGPSIAVCDYVDIVPNSLVLRSFESCDHVHRGISISTRRYFRKGEGSFWLHLA